MAQKIKQGNIFGRIGSGIGQGLAEQVPKEIERARLASGLQSFEKEHQNLSPMQQLARLSAIPGITPQTIQSFSELAKTQNLRGAYQNLGKGGSQQAPSQGQSNFQDIQFGNAQSGQPQGKPVQGQKSPPVASGEFGQPQIMDQNPLNENQFTRAPWSPERRNQSIASYLDQGFLPNQAQELQADDEARDLAQPGAAQARFAELKQKQEDARKELSRQLETKLQKTGDALYADVSGPELIGLQRGMERDLRLKPNATLQDVANDWSNRALEMAKAKGKVEKLGATTGIESFVKGDAIYKKLKDAQSIFQNAGNLEEYSNLLQKNFGMSPQGAAVVAFPTTKELGKYIDNFKSGKDFRPKYREEIARKAAVDIGDLLTENDSLLAIAKELKGRYPYFDEQAFFDQISEDKDRMRLNSRQRLELTEHNTNLLPNWGDLLVLPRRGMKWY